MLLADEGFQVSFLQHVRMYTENLKVHIHIK